MEVVGNYSLSIEIGGVVTSISPNMIRELTITEDVERLLPTFKLTLKDATDILSNVMPYDRDSNSVRIEFSRGNNAPEPNAFDFAVKRRSTTSPDAIYSIEGVLSVPQILTERKNRSLSGNIKLSLENLAQTDLKISSTEIGQSLNYEKTILQPNWTDAKLLRYLRQNLIGKSGEAGYYTYVKVKHGQQTLVVKSLDELLSTPVQYKFIMSHKGHEDFYPVSQYRVFDNSPLFTDLGGQTQAYRYFDWNTGTYVDDSVAIGGCPALSEFFLVDSDNHSNSTLYTGTGRSNDFTADFKGRVRNDFYRRLNSNISLWISTWGIENAAPGGVVQVMFSEALERDNLSFYQHTGLWMIKRVVHIIGTSFMTNFELVRCGIDTDVRTTLLKTTNRKNR